MKKLLLALCLLCLAVPVGAMDSIDAITAPNSPEFMDADIVTTIDPSLYTLAHFNQSITIGDIDLLELLKRCREFVDDYSDRIYETTITVEPLIYLLPPTWYDYLKQQNEDEIEKAKDDIEMRNRERKLRQDIETLIKTMEVK